jgi:hypothetical protein
VKKHILLLALCVVIAGSAGAVPNPSAVYCIKCGYQYQIRTDSTGGQYGVCVFPDGSECEAWTYYRKCNSPQICSDCNCPWPCPTRIIYVDDDAEGANNGISWQDAYKYLQDALADANSARNPVEIRVAQGIYTPDRGKNQTPPDRYASFQLINGVTIKGGYAGLDARDPNARDVARHETILSGDLNGNDVDVNDPLDLLHDPTRTENSYHVVTGSRTDKTAVLEGLKITGGNVNEDVAVPSGGGMCNLDGSPTVTNCTFSGNSAKYYGGGMFNEDSRPTVTNCIFSANSAEKYGGGGMYNVRSSPTVNGCTFTANSAIGDFGSGGGMGNFDSSPTVKSCTFTDNSAQYSGGGMCNDNSSPRVTNCTFTANSAKYRGGGMFNYDNSSPTVTNCTIAYNSSANGPAVACDSSEHRYPSSITMVNSVVWNGHNWLWNNDRSTIIVTYSNIQGGYSGRWWSGNINADPCFADATDGDYHLKSEAGRWDPNNQSWVKDDVTSPCIDAGDPTSPIGYEPFPNGGRINMGAYGGTGEASKSYFGEPVCETIVAGDINGDCKVDFADFAIMALHWLEEH